MAKTIAFVLYPGITPLDLVGPLQVLSALAEFDRSFDVVVAAHNHDVLETDTPVRLQPSHSFDEVTEPFAVMVPGGGAPTLAAMKDRALVAQIASFARTAQWVGSVCTGSLILGAAGLLAGRRATTHWGFRDRLAAFGAEAVAERWVVDGKLITAAGVSAGIDMALHVVERLAGEQMARKVQLAVEYDPQPPLGGIDWQSPEVSRYAQPDGWTALTASRNH
ncbi:DJ-1/PfpI family protein [Actinoplanes sp. TFC3]|uniref:DJ-1/PfpI family protein n=1 Tax=Actinoplanes sp. TFC3 TaxID=1710355 RepID=UPI0008336145|nr:DJ-1/PfpI family protein [Actinoplanes sp. TFC3]